MTNRGWSALAAAITTLLVLGSVSACDRADEHAQFTIDAAAVSGPDTLGLSAAGEPIKAVVVYFHGMDQKADVTQSDVKHKSFVQALLRAGYAVVSADASRNAFGNPVSRQQYRDLVRAAEQKYRAPATFYVAESMGALPALALLSEDHGHTIRGMIGISPLMGLPPRGASIHFVADAWGGSLPPEADPLAWPAAAFANRNFELYASADDHVVPADASAREFANRFGAVADVRVTSCSGGHVAGDCFRGDDVVAWMTSLTEPA
jgi:hypothetical protein